MSKLSQQKRGVLDRFESRTDAWTYRDFENDLEKAMGRRYGNYQTAKMTIIEAHKIGSWPLTVERYLRTNLKSLGSLPVELIPVGQHFDL